MDDLLRDNIKDKHILFMDCETNSLSLFYALPFDISFIIYKGYQKIEERQFYIKWKDYKINEDLARKVHYNKELIEKLGLEPQRAMEIVNEYVNGKYDIIAGNNLLNYDNMVLYNSCKNVNLNLGYDWLKKVYDCNAIFKGWKRDIKPDYSNFLAWQFSQNNFVQRGLKSNVSYICKEFGIVHNEEDLHGSLADTILSSKIFFELIKKVELK